MVKVCSDRGRARRAGFTIAYQDPRPDQNPKDLTCVDPYQTLPDPVLTERNRMVDLVWSACGLPTVTTTLHVPDDPFWLVWISLPIPTILRIWMQAYRASPLPTFTTATGTGHYRLL
jgi:hypothetical protein